MPTIEYGHDGAPLLYLPSSGGNEREFGRYGMEKSIANWLVAGKVRVFSADARGARTLFAPTLSPRERIRRYALLETYLSRELIPWILDRTGYARLTVVGSSYGAFVAANLLFKHYDSVKMACGLGGVYEMWHRLDGFHDAAVYAHTPIEYLPRLTDLKSLSGIRGTHGLEMYAAADDEWLPQTGQLERILLDKALPHAVHVWPSPARHHERVWRLQLRDFIERQFGRPDS